MTIDAYEILHEIPEPADYVRLRTVAGLTPPPAAAVAAGLANSVHAVIAVRTDDASGARQVVGMVRLTGDGHIFCLITDMAVDPAHQRRGLGRKLLGALLEWIDEHAPDAYVTLIGDAPGQALYKSVGFAQTSGIGMKRGRWGM